ncbi:hypothetical protein AV530_004318 [Patagioenas fasciata monilis]|uniref:Uncharacterized protein n=1 Tax=Patagioenas fasciata monilis TaxID=372326 RepID=A0A1V4K924_PATFA|nr:hypothetical protein AV530_004318 [Patagioenas fasciata monilis]
MYALGQQNQSWTYKWQSSLSAPLTCSCQRQHKTPRHCFPVHEQKLLAAAEEFPSVSYEAAVKYLPLP